MEKRNRLILTYETASFYWCMLRACFHKGGKKKEHCERSEQRLSLVKHPQYGLARPQAEQHYRYQKGQFAGSVLVQG